MFGPPLDPAFLTAPIAHRGLHDRAAGVIENSRAAVAAAVEAGYGIEIDLQLSADGEAMVFHDDELTRLTAERGPVRDRTAIELRRIDLDGGDEGIPTLAEILDIVRGAVPLLIEAKDQSLTLTEVDGRLERRAARLLAAYDGPVEDEALQSVVYAVGRDRFDPLRGWFTALYEVLLGASQGPRF
ncbi:MAG: glycerophosphodiester phosphodiesterase family protein, partial [Pseudomonadota bacterium]